MLKCAYFYLVALVFGTRIEVGEVWIDQGRCTGTGGGLLGDLLGGAGNGGRLLCLRLRSGRQIPGLLVLLLALIDIVVVVIIVVGVGGLVSHHILIIIQVIVFIVFVLDFVSLACDEKNALKKQKTYIEAYLSLGGKLCSPIRKH